MQPGTWLWLRVHSIDWKQVEQKLTTVVKIYQQGNSNVGQQGHCLFWKAILRTYCTDSTGGDPPVMGMTRGLALSCCDQGSLEVPRGEHVMLGSPHPHHSWEMKGQRYMGV